MYQLRLSPATITKITDKVIPEIEQWQARQLECVISSCGWMLLSKRSGGINASRRRYTSVIGVDRDGVKDLFDMYVGRREKANF
jgi:transposase-like protein